MSQSQASNYMKELQDGCSRKGTNIGSDKTEIEKRINKLKVFKETLDPKQQTKFLRKFQVLEERYADLQ